MATNSATHILDPTLLAELKRLELRTRRALSADVMGNYRSAFRGSGLVFSDLREYAPGDDVKSIHWKATARSQKVYVKSYHEDRSLQVVLCVDVSSSTNFGIGKSLHQKAFELAACIALLAEQSGDSVGLLLFGAGVELFERPRTGKRAVEHVLLTLLKPRELSGQSDLSGALRHILKHQKRKSLVFVISDFHTPDFKDMLRQLSFRHEVVLVQLAAQSLMSDFENEIPDLGLVLFRDPESGYLTTVDTSNRRVRAALKESYWKQWEELRATSRELQVDLLHVGERVLPPLIELMRRRQSHRGGKHSHVIGPLRAESK